MLHLEIFDKTHVRGVPVTNVDIPRDLDYLKRQYNYNKSAIEKYYLDANIAVKNTHIISRMVEHFTLKLDYSLHDFLSVLETDVTDTAKNFQLTSGRNKGIVHPPHFYGNYGNSIIINEYKPIDPKYVSDNWRTINCLDVLTHSRNDSRLLLPTGLDDGSKSGLSVININLFILGIKYREFVKEQNLKLKANNSLPVLTKNNFVSKYVIPGTLESDIDHRFLNMIIDSYYENKIIVPKYRHKFPIQESRTQLDRYIEQVINTISTKDLDFVNVMNNIPLIFSSNATELLSFESIPNSRQSNWAYLTSRLKHMCFLYDVSKNKDRSITYINDWKLLIKQIESDGSMFGSYSGDTQKEINEYVYKIKNM